MSTVIETHNLKKHYRMGETIVRALDGVSLTVADGEFVGRVINIAANIYIPSQGGTAATLFSLPWWLVGGATELG